MKTYDLIVIGAGPGGYEAAFEAADLGMRAALIEKDALGGTCLNRGCIPTKSLLHGAELFREINGAGLFGVDAERITADWPRMQARKAETVRQLREGIAATAKKKKVDCFRGTGVCLGNGRVSVRTEEGAEELSAGHILLATGSRPAVPPIPGADLPGVVTSDGLLEAESLPPRLVIIGGGVIGVEFASLFSALGTEVTVIEALPQLLPNLDREIGQSLKMLMKKRNIRVFTGARVREIRREAPGSLICAYESGQELLETSAETVLISTGRRPYTDGLFAEGILPETDRGRILVSESGETSLPGIYAIGDVTGGIMLAHAASAAGRNAVRRMAGRTDLVDTRFIPSCVYTDPEIACVGLTLEEAKAAGLSAESRKVPMGANGRTVIAGAERGYIRIVYEKESGKLLGAQLMCQRATDLISEFTQALCAGQTLREMARVIRPHPTFSEAVSELLAP